MATMTVDAKILRDPRMLRLCKRLAWKPRETLGALLSVWAICYDNKSPVIESHEDIDTAADHDGFAEGMISVGLAEPTEAGILIRGATKRLRQLADAIDNGRKGGLSSQAKRRAAYSDSSPRQATLDLPSSEGLPPNIGLDADQKGAFSCEGQGSGGERPPPPEAVKLAARLLERICGNHPTSRVALTTAARPAVKARTVSRWGHTIRLMNERDGLAYDHIATMIEWSQDHTWWRGNILGADSLRDSWDTMVGQRQRGAQGRGDEGRRGPTAQGVDRVRQLEREEAEQERQRGAGGA